MSGVRFRIVDVFTDRPLSGNALCVVLDPVDPGIRQALAREVHLSETTFTERRGPGAYRMAIHTPTTELPFAGHPSLGTAWVLGPGTWTQVTAGATVVVRATDRGAEMDQPDPVLVDVDPAPLEAAAGLPAGSGRSAVVSELAGNRLAVLAVASAEDVGRVAVDPAAVTAMAPMLAVVGLAGPGSLAVRVFCPGVGIPEDPGTGSAAGPVGLVARHAWGLDSGLVLRQGVELGRPCTIEVHAEPGAMRVGGAVVSVAEGTFTLPD